MSANVFLGAMVAVSIAAVATSSKWERPIDPPFQRTPPETPWLTPELAAQVVGPDGGLGPLFEGFQLGGIAPSAETRERIAAFARTNKLTIDLEIENGWLNAVRFEVLFGGCCGYEGADTLALRLHRPQTQTCCGCQESWLDDWVVRTDGGIGRAYVRVNRVVVRWEPELTIEQLVEVADDLIGRDRITVGQEMGERLTEIAPNEKYSLQVPYVLDEYWMPGNTGIELTVASGRIVEASMRIREDRETGMDGTMSALRSRWGRPRKHHDNEWTWKTTDRVVIADLDYQSRVSIQKRSVRR